MRKQTLRRTSLLSLLGLKSSASASATPWNTSTPLDVSSTTALITSDRPSISPASSTETLVATLPRTSDVTLVDSSTSAEVTSTTDGTTLTTTEDFTPTTSSDGVASSSSVRHVTATSEGGSATTTTTATPRTRTEVVTASVVLLPSPDSGPKKFVKMGMTGVLGAAAGLFMI